jgi:hypothetical protein
VQRRSLQPCKNYRCFLSRGLYLRTPTVTTLRLSNLTWPNATTHTHVWRQYSRSIGCRIGRRKAAIPSDSCQILRRIAAAVHKSSEVTRGQPTGDGTTTDRTPVKSLSGRSSAFRRYMPEMIAVCASQRGYPDLRTERRSKQCRTKGSEGPLPRVWRLPNSPRDVNRCHRPDTMLLARSARYASLAPLQSQASQPLFS